MKAPAFWWTPRRSLAAHALAPAAAVVGRVAARRMARPPAERLAIPVICIGNPTVGGAGKTPVAIAVARALQGAGAAPVFLTRGYGGRAREPVVVAHETAGEVGDEPMLLAAVVPTVVSPDRAAGGRLAARLGNVVVMDDGFQNPGLHKTWSAMVIDGAVGLGNGAVTPAGPLRAPLTAHMGADAWLVVTGDDAARAPLPTGIGPVHEVRLTAAADAPLAGVPVLAFAGIGRPSKFFASAAALGADIRAAVPFADHHAFTDAEADGLIARADALGAVPLTTAKDMVRLQTGGRKCQRLAALARVVTVEASLPDTLVREVLRLIG
ncbi:tetraacyldisaccharide 4'-kinase [Acuticoccus yangtzensis]|uniref:tetraacyldisaccharide 4'-kinase n=1 Tax=Acuticoccus yangtzensis TaxID=1443441 RepID=UPI0009497E7C|nr:tetraacyldisaccharide 4'-kinase [Acuticoccus yangtzensis]